LFLLSLARWVSNLSASISSKGNSDPLTVETLDIEDVAEGQDFSPLFYDDVQFLDSNVQDRSLAEEPKARVAAMK
jgi:hypothetical protein